MVAGISGRCVAVPVGLVLGFAVACAGAVAVNQVKGSRFQVVGGIHPSGLLQHFLYFSPDSQGQGSFLPVFGSCRL